MRFALLIRILRKRIVLSAIFILSLTYCVLSFWQEGVSDIASNDIDSDVPVRKVGSSFLWRSDNESNVASLKVVSCRNSVQGKVLIVDDRGYICSRSDVLPSGCCNIIAESTKHFACDTCKSSGCCSIYEYCISCCLHPDKKNVLQAVLGKASENVLYASVTDHFELCLAKCRTSSQSVHHENSYRDPRAKHCYGEIPKTEVIIIITWGLSGVTCFSCQQAMSLEKLLTTDNDLNLLYNDVWLKKRWFSCSKRFIVMAVIAISTIAIIVVATVNPLENNKEKVQTECEVDPPDVTEPPPPSESVYGNYRRAAVATNGYLCAKVGKDVLLENGTAVDAAIAALICEGVLCPQSMGIGGGFIMTIYDKVKGEVKVLNAREYAPIHASEDMYGGNATASEIGGLAVAVPTELRGYEEAYKKYGGGVSWKRLFAPTIKICEEGFSVYPYLAYHLKKNENLILSSATLREIFVNPKTGKVLREGELLTRPKLAKTLTIIAENGAAAFYEGPLAEEMVREIQNNGGIMTLEDLKNAKVDWQEPLKSTFGRYTMYTSHLPGSGVLLNFMLNILNDFIPASEEGVTYHRIAEAFKFGYGRRTELGDISQDYFVPSINYTRELIGNLTSEAYAEEIRRTILDNATHQDPKYYGAKVAEPSDFGTAHISVIAENGDAVSVTSTINLLFGAKFRSNSTGIIYNNEMSDFSAPNITNPFGIPPSPTNFIKPGKRPLSSMCPTIFVDENNDAILVTGASGGSRITTTTILVIINNLLFGKNIKESIDARRIHHQLFPMELDYEYGFLAENVKKLQEIGHKTCRSSTRTTSTVTSVARHRGNITANYDYRRGGAVDGY